MHIKLNEFYKELRERNEREWGNRRFEIARHLGIQSHASFSDLLPELLQNAEDARAQRFGFRILPEGLLVWNDGQPFDQKDVKAIAGLLISSKKEDAIGYFGIGFKAVLLITRTPCILSGEYRFWLQEGIDPYPLAGGEPEPPHVPAQVQRMAAQYTVFWLPWRADVTDETFRRWLEEHAPFPSSLLFLNRLKTIEMDSLGRWSVRREELSAKATVLTLSGPNGETRYIRFSWTAIPPRDVVQKVVEALYEHDLRRERWQNKPPPGLFGLALALDPKGRPQPETGKVFVYLPTAEETGFHFHLQGQMALTGDRKRLKSDDPLTRWALEELRNKAPRWPEWFDSAGLFPAVWRVLPGPRDAQERWQGVAEALREALREGSHFYGDDGRPYTRDQVFLAHREEIYDLITTDDLEEITGREGARWVHPDMRRENARKVVQSLGVQEVEAEAIISWLARQTEPTWWEAKPLPWLQKLYRYLEKTNSSIAVSVLKRIPLVRIQSGSHVLPDQSVFPPEEGDKIPEALRKYLDTMPVVHQDLATGFRGLLSTLGTRDFHIENLIDRFLKSQYGNEQCPTPEENVRHIRLLFMLYEQGHIGQEQKFREWGDLPILRDMQGNWVRPREAYLPPDLGGVPEMLIYLNMAGGRPIVVFDYREKNEEPQKWGKFLARFGCAKLPRLKLKEEAIRGQELEQWCRLRNIQYENIKWYISDKDNKRFKGLDWQIDGFLEIMELTEDARLSIEGAKALWVITALIFKASSCKHHIVEWPGRSRGQKQICLCVSESLLTWFYGYVRSSPGKAWWLARLQDIQWLPDAQGHSRYPTELFDPALKDLLGEEGFVYLHPDIPLKGHREWAKTLGVRLEASLEEVCNALETRLEQYPEPTMVEPVYKWLNDQVEKRTSGVERDKIIQDLREIFAGRPLIFVPNRGLFKRTEVCWLDPSGVMPSLKKAWPGFYNFFVQILEVPEIPEVKHIARFLIEALQARKETASWLEAARAIQDRWDELDTSLQDDLRALKWPGIKKDKQMWVAPERLLLPDNLPLKRRFENGDAQFAWWALKGLENLARHLGVRPVSEAEPDITRGSDLGAWDEIQDRLASLWEAVRWFATAYGKKIPEHPPEVRKTNKIEVVYRLGRTYSATRRTDATLDDAGGQYVLWVTKTQEHNYSYQIGTVLEEHFEVNHLREFLKEIWDVQSADGWHRALKRWAEDAEMPEWPEFPGTVSTRTTAEHLPASRMPAFTKSGGTRIGGKTGKGEIKRGPQPYSTGNAGSRFSGFTRVHSAEAHLKAIEARQELESRAMRAAQIWLQREGFRVTDVSRQNTGYDLEAIRGEEVRYVEVKGVKRQGQVNVTANEWQAARRYDKAYWLFVYVSENRAAWVLPGPASLLKASPAAYTLDGIWEIAKQIAIDQDAISTAQDER